MSDYFIRLIPVEPEYLPAQGAQDKAAPLLAMYLPRHDMIEGRVTEGIEFVDCGCNLERITCPVCSTQVNRVWWNDAMDKVYKMVYKTGVDGKIQSKITPSKQGFRNLQVEMPCCGATTSLNDLKYHWPAGFSRFCLEALNPDSYGLEQEQILALEQILGCNLRQIWAHL